MTSSVLSEVTVKSGMIIVLYKKKISKCMFYVKSTKWQTVLSDIPAMCCHWRCPHFHFLIRTRGGAAEPSGALGNLSLLPGCCLKQQTWHNVDPKMTGCQLINFLKLISTHTRCSAQRCRKCGGNSSCIWWASSSTSVLIIITFRVGLLGNKQKRLLGHTEPI